MLPSNHAIHDNTMGSYTTSISWRSLEGCKDGGTRPEQPCTSCHLRDRPRNLGGCSWCPSCPPSREKRSSLLVFFGLLPRLAHCHDCLLEVLEHILFNFVVQVGIRVQPRRPLSIAASHRLLQFWTGNTARAWHFGTVIGNQNLLRSSALCLLPLYPCHPSESFLIELHQRPPVGTSEVCPRRARPRVN